MSSKSTVVITTETKQYYENIEKKYNELVQKLLVQKSNESSSERFSEIKRGLRNDILDDWTEGQ